MNERQTRRVSPLAEVELEALEAGREWTRRRIERKLQKLAHGQGAISPPEPAAHDPLPPDADTDQDLRRRGGD